MRGISRILVPILPLFALCALLGGLYLLFASPPSPTHSEPDVLVLVSPERLLAPAIEVAGLFQRRTGVRVTVRTVPAKDGDVLLEESDGALVARILETSEAVEEAGGLAAFMHGSTVQAVFQRYGFAATENADNAHLKTR